MPIIGNVFVQDGKLPPKQVLAVSAISLMTI